MWKSVRAAQSPQNIVEDHAPNAQADILAGMRIGLTVALILAVIGEMLTSENGLGVYAGGRAAVSFPADLFVVRIVLGVIGLVSTGGGRSSAVCCVDSGDVGE